MKINFIDLQAQYEAYRSEIDEEVLKVFASAQFIGGEQLQKLESSLAEYTGAKHAIGCSSGTDALLLALMALDIGPGDEVVTTPFTFIATAEVIALVGAKPVFVDIDETTYNIDTGKIEAAITEKTKAIIPVSLYGQCADMDTINEIASRYGITVIEDACQSFGATYKGRRSCNLSTIGCTSFFPSKPLGAYGDGGAVFTSDDALAKKIRMLLSHGQSERYKHTLVGINGRLDAVQAAVLNVKLRHFEDEVEKRESIGARYSELLRSSAVVTPKIAQGYTSVYAQYSIRVKDRRRVVEALGEKGVPTAVHYPVPLHLQEVFKPLGYAKGDFPVSEKVSEEILSLPMSPFLTQEQQAYVVETIKEVLNA